MKVKIVLTLRLKEIFDPGFVRAVLDRKGVEANNPLGRLLRSSTSTTLVRNRILEAFSHKRTYLFELTRCTPDEVRSMAKLGPKTLRWLEEYLSLLGVVLYRIKSVHGMRKTVREVLNSL